MEDTQIPFQNRLASAFGRIEREASLPGKGSEAINEERLQLQVLVVPCRESRGDAHQALDSRASQDLCVLQ